MSRLAKRRGSRIAADGVSSATEKLPFADRIQASFGHHNVGTARAQVGGPAATATAAMGSDAYTYGSKIGFGRWPSLHVAAHEAAHLVQQRSDRAIDQRTAHGAALERQADRVAGLVVSGRSAQAELDSVTGTGAAEKLAGAGPSRPALQFNGGPIMSGTTQPVSTQLTNLGAFFEGVLDGAGQNLDQRHLDDLEANLAAMTVLNMVFPVPFLGGAVVGIVTEIWESVRGLVEAILGLEEILDAVQQLVDGLSGPGSEAFARGLGTALGEDFAAELQRLSQLDVGEFAYEVGKILGPLILAVILTFVTGGLAGAVATGARGGKVVAFLTRWLTRIPGMRGRVIAMRIKWRGRHGPPGRLPLPSTPGDMGTARFGNDVMRWGTGDASARDRIGSLTTDELRRGGVTRQIAEEWRDFYINEKARVPTNPSAQGRAELMQRAVELLGE